MPLDSTNWNAEDDVVRVLRRAVEHLDRYGWTQNALVRENASACAEGLICVGTGRLTFVDEGLKRTCPSESSKDQAWLAKRVRRYVYRAVYGHHSSIAPLAYWNDEECKGPDEVREAFLRAIDLRHQDLIKEKAHEQA